MRQGADSRGYIKGAWRFNPSGALVEGPQGMVTHLICGGVYDWSTGLIYKGGRYFDPNLGLWLALTPLVVVQGWRGPRKKRRWAVGVSLALLVLCASSTLTGCCGPVPQPLPTQVCTEIATAAFQTPGYYGHDELGNPRIVYVTSAPTPTNTPTPSSGGTALVLPIKDPVYHTLYSNDHRAYDITSLSGNRTVYSMGYGTVAETDVHNDNPTWYYLRVRMDAGYYINYVHIEHTDLWVGDRVEPDTIIGTYGAVGDCRPRDFAHLHVQFESPIYQGIDPAPYWPGGAP